MLLRFRLPLLLLLLASFTPAGAQALVRVLLAVEPQVTVVAEGAHRGSVDGIPAFHAPLGLSWPIRLDAGRLVIDDRPVGHSMLLEGGALPLEFAGHHYRGAIRLTATDAGIEVINVVDVEEYLRGVVPAEMSASWPAEALKAQAVAARSYTLTSLAPAKDYDLCATVDCQVYRGIDAEDGRSDQAVEATRGIVLSYGGVTARTYYHSDSGGAVASSQEVWGTALPYLVARADVTSRSPHAAWQVRLDPNVIAASLAAIGRNVGTVRAVRVLALTESGRVSELEVEGGSGHTVLRGVQVTHLARAWGLKSTRFRSLGGLTVAGEGWGHGVGMSQYGARALAGSSYDYAQILAYYYPHTQLTRVVTPRAQAR